ncbi:MAG: Asp-tRNA(Asn)/Glu-tRNA(Gln) amidotransferase subunit GatB [Chlamydiae bacterium]|nr:Asp-tRNA(Asn)/Glu-tRNA(Gln) amidotransferase subunit GatB [Chlamydiota bacterium]
MSELLYENWKPVIGLEIHVQLNTKSKLFSSAPNHFGDEPNTNIGVVDTGQPGTLPVLNKEAVKKALQFGLAVNGTISRKSYFDRKSYFYPDSPRNFQITQFYQPIITGGTLTCDVAGQTKHFAIHHTHLEDDSGMLKHFTSFAGIDYNRAGIPLIEIVSEPCMHSPKDASAYAMGIKAIMQYLDASDCNMEEGSLRIDVNVSIKTKDDKTLRPKVEVKNLNSFHYMELAIEAEIRRQIQAYSRNPHQDHKIAINAGTYRFDVERKETILMRKKEEAQDYRYFPEPDLPPLILTDEYIEEIRTSLPELPHERYQRYIADLHLSPDSSSILVNDKFTSDFFEEGVKICKNPTALCNWIIVEFTGRLKEKGISLKESQIKSSHIAKLVRMIDQEVITGKIAKMVADEMVANPEKDSELIVKENPNYQPLQDAKEIETIIEEVLKAFPDSVADYKSGKTKAFAYLIGQVMKQTQGKASPQIVNDLLRKKLE